jgi:hypothetical protein
MEQTFNPVLRSIGRILRDRDEDIAKQALPERWVELIGRLDDKAKMVCGQRISQISRDSRFVKTELRCSP